MNPFLELQNQEHRRAFLEGSALGLGAMALGSLVADDATAAERKPNGTAGVDKLPHFPARVRRVIYLFQSGGPAQMDLFDYKPGLVERFGEEVPKSIYPDERKTTMTSGQNSFPVAPTALRFQRHGECGMWLSEPQRYLAQVVDDICVVKSMYTEAINHDPAATLFQTGSVIAGRPSMGAWVSYGLGSENANLPAFVALTSNGSAKAGQPLYDRLWGAGFLPGRFQGVKFRGQGDPILDLNNPPGMSREQRRRTLDSLKKLNAEQASRYNDPAIATRIAQYELAFRMQMSVPELVDVRDEPQSVLNMYGPEATHVGKYAYNCLLARRLAERRRTIHSTLPSWLGRTWQRSQGRRRTVPRHGSTDRGAACGFEAARNARRYTGRVGWRIRTHRLLPRQTNSKELRPRSPPQLLYVLARRRRRERGNDLRRNRRLQRERRRKSSPCS